MKSYADIGGFNAICQVCREKIKSKEAVRRWDGLIVSRLHEGCFETRHPADMPKPVIRDDKPLPFTSPETTDEFVGVCSVQGRSGIAGYATAGCSIAGQELFSLGLFNDGVPSGTFSGELDG